VWNVWNVQNVRVCTVHFEALPFRRLRCATAARACAELGLAWMQGSGTRKQSRFAAIEWANRAVALQSSDPLIEEIQAEIRNSHSRVKTLFTVCGAALFRGDLHASELPPKATGHHRASA
jgi:hypothetical protein